MFSKEMAYLIFYLCVMSSGFITGLIIYNICKYNKKSLKSSNNEEIIKIINTMKKDLIINKDKYSFIDINIIIDIYIKNKCEYNDDIDDINNFIENKRKSIINEIKIKLLINYKNDLINKIIMEKNILNTKLNIDDLKKIKDNIEEHKKELNNLFDLVNEINIIDIRITND